MMAFASFGPHGFVCPTMSEHGGPRGSSGHLIGRMIMRASVVTGSYGLIVLLPVDKNHDQLSPACAIAGRLVLVAPVHPPSSRTANAAGRCRSFRTCLSLSFHG
jgi:hypothetical protein